MSDSAVGGAPKGGPGAAWTLLVSGLILVPVLGYRMGLDQGTYAYVAAGLAEGRWPYLQTWDHQFPGGMILHAVEILLLGRSPTMFRLADLLFQLANVFLIYRITRHVASPPAGFLAGVVYALIYQSYGPWNTGQREGYGLFLALLALLLYLTRSRRTDPATAWWSGLCFGGAVLIKPTLLALVAMYVPLLRYRTERTPWRTSLRLAAIAGAGVLLPALLVIAFYWYQDGLIQMYEACIAYQTDVYMHRLRGTAPLWQYWISKLGRLGSESILLGLASLPLLALGANRRTRLMVWLAYVASIYTVFVQGTFAGYHYLTGLGFGAILIGSGFHEVANVAERVLARWGGAFGWRAWNLVAHALIVAAIPVYMSVARLEEVLSLRFLERPRPHLFTVGNVFDYTESHDVAEYLRANTTSEDRIQVWGHESLVYYLADRLAAGRFQSTNGLVMRVPGAPITPMQERWREEFMAAMRSMRPRFIVVTRGDRWWWAPAERTSEELIDDFPAFRDLIAQRYERDREIGKYLVYRRIEGGGPP